MTSSVRILVVDDDLATLEFLRSILALAQDDFEVLGVASAEEALLALERTDFKLLITDVRLPGINGIELVRAAWEVRPSLPVIMITAYSLSEVDEEVAGLDVDYYFRKPLDAEDFLEAVFAAIQEQEKPSQKQAVEQPKFLKPPDSVAERLDMLRTDTGARHAILATTRGQLLYLGGTQPVFDLANIITTITTILNTSLRLAAELDQDKPLAVHFLSGETLDLYMTNIDSDYFIAIFIDARTRRGRIGSLWVFTQRAVKDIRQLLADEPAALVDQPYQPELFTTSSTLTAGVGQALSDALTLEEEFLPAGEGPTYEQLDEPVIQPHGPSADNEPEELGQEPGHSLLEADQFESLLEQIDGDQEAVEEVGGDIDAFWDEAVDNDLQSASPGLSLEEAREQGLIASEFEDEED